MTAEGNRRFSWVRKASWSKLLMIAANVGAAGLVVWGFVVREYYPVTPQELKAFGSTFFGRIASHSRLTEIQIEGSIGRTAVYLFFTGYVPAMACGLVAGLCGIPIGKAPPRPLGVWTMTWSILFFGLVLGYTVNLVVFDTRWGDVSELLIGAVGPLWSVFIPYGSGIVLALLLHFTYLLAQRFRGRPDSTARSS